jgi:hypothetical protein
MSVASGPARPEKHLYLWMLAAGPTIWAAHFLLSYITAAVWCAKFGGREGMLAPVHTAIGWYTVVALAGIGLVGASGYERHGRGFETDEHERDAPGDRRRFLGFAALLLAGLSAIATIYVAVSVMFLERCY